MKRFFILGLIYCVLCSCVSAKTHIKGCHGYPHRGSYYHNNYSSSSSPSIYLVNKDHTTSEEHFQNCNEHYMVIDTTTYYYSDGSRRILNNYNIYNSDGTVLKNNCQSVHHFLQNKKHYFIVRENREYSIINATGDSITEHKYSWIEEIAPDRFLVKYDKKYGIIDLNEKLILDIKYQKFQRYSQNIFITKLNGYYGLANAYGKILVKNDCEKIKPYYSTILLKRYGKYGLTDLEGNLILPAKEDKIKYLGEYIIAEKNKLTRIYNSEGIPINSNVYKKVKLERNTLYGLKENSVWEKVDL